MIGQVLDGYKIIDILGRGGMGIVYKAEDQELRNIVALKMIDPALANDETFVLRFRREAQALARIDSRHVVRVHALRRTSQGLFIVMEYVDGGTVADLILEGPLELEQATTIIDQMLQAFEAAHSVGIVHRDIKPANVMLTQSGVVKVTDFGLAKRYREGEVTQATVTQGIAGTLYYMSPEQVQGRKDLDHRSDIFAIGVTIYRMLAGRLPIEKESGEFAVMRAIVESEWPPPSTYNPDLSPAVDAFVMRALAKDPEARYQSVREMRLALSKLAEEPEEKEQAQEPTTARPAWLVPALSLLGVALVAVVLYLLLRPEPEIITVPDPPPVTTGVVRFVGVPADARIRINDRSVQPGEEVELEAGPANVVIEKDGFYTWTRRVEIEPGETESLIVDLEPEADLPPPPTSGAIRLTGVPADATVRIDGERVNHHEDIAWRAGQARVVVEKDGFRPWSREVQVRGGEVEQLQVALERIEENVAPTTVALTLTPPPGGSVSLAGGQVLRSQTTVRVQPGTQQVTFAHPTYGTWTTSVDITRARTLTAHFEQQVNVQVEPIGGTSMYAALWVDGEDMGSTPRALTLGRGIHTINITKDGYEVLDGEKTIEIKPSLQARDPLPVVFRMRKR